MNILTLQCYRCGTEYEYVGTPPHPGQCPVCGSPCVPPAGSLTVLNSSQWESANGLSKVWVYALDEQNRPFEFEVAGKGKRGKLVALRVDGISVDLNVDESFERLPPAVKTKLVEAGIERVETNTHKQPK
ncbi:hypothetical protein D8Y22_11985 [Salinadaptatus halalkaliphilus]|uniref:Rubredoxin-like domain-containing protein n=1 Tax=Salinadaptatus halalkaliphilus TaxID=2419781 RepID=A0A4V3VL78_9EURY|nr:hypothetical protein D8Y22_11985 [Salinadaptatus halalkaliphilus]